MKSKKKGGRRLKRDWRRKIDVADVDTYLDEERLKERIGSTKDQKDEDLFHVDTSGKNIKKEKTKKKTLDTPLKCLSSLHSSSAIPPLAKRSTKKIKKSLKIDHEFDKNIKPLKKTITKKKKLKEINKILKSKVKLLTDNPVNDIFKKDLWSNYRDPGQRKDKLTKNVLSWLPNEVLKHNAKVIPSLISKTMSHPNQSNVDDIKMPHPGLSYNPAIEDHVSLLENIAVKETEFIKHEAHIKRCTQKLFKQVSQDTHEKMIIEEMTEGLPGFQNDTITVDTVEDNSEYKAINPPTTRDNQKTQKKRKIQRRLRNEEAIRMKAKIEKKKISDLYKLRFINQELDELEHNECKKKIKRLKKRQLHNMGTRRLGTNKFVEKSEVFALPNEIKGTLRETAPEGNIFKDCFESLQVRNILPVGKKQLKINKKKVQAFMDPAFKVTPDMLAQFKL
ncbi:ribosome biogenesis protein NOP53 isoform X2 [Daktulosphaira vitifoliae]|nr:ribosome biogenesis protein NOP53 isoform X2 [Daktulosphaira vitifoliae]XP_050540774.1 ribosome biogenesis protein NOP53 isoform X2 [Daktulosphaira vitifoliae]XP_050540775.1 ribosome biogenesis protein NOP53 isoform X2 [Daktulosphaira vitifoliae]